MPMSSDSDEDFKVLEEAKKKKQNAEDKPRDRKEGSSSRSKPRKKDSDSEDEELAQLRAAVEKKKKRDKEKEELRRRLAEMDREDSSSASISSSSFESRSAIDRSVSSSSKRGNKEMELEIARLKAQLASSSSSSSSHIESASTQRMDDMNKQIAMLNAKLKELASPSVSKPTRDPTPQEKKLAEIIKQRKQLEEELARMTVGTDASRSVTDSKLASLKRDTASMHSRDLETSYKEKKRDAEKITYGIDLAIVMDCTGSMSAWITEARRQALAIIDATKKFDQRANPRIAFVGYRDLCDPQNERYIVENFRDRETAQQLVNTLNGVQATGGGDAPEDIYGAFQKAANDLSWRSSTRLIVHVADAPCHGAEYHNFGSTGDSYPTGDPSGQRPEDVLRTFCNKRIDYYFCGINTSTDIMISKFKTVYDNTDRVFQKLMLGDGVDKFLPMVLNSVKESMRASAAFM